MSHVLCGYVELLPDAGIVSVAGRPLDEPKLHFGNGFTVVMVRFEADEEIISRIRLRLLTEVPRKTG